MSGYYHQYFEDDAVKDNFDKALKFTLDPSIEGRIFSDTVGDRGGPTRCGITLKTLKDYYAHFDYGDFDLDGDVDIDDIRLLDTPEEAAPIYKKWFWDVIKGDYLPAGVDYVVFDSAVNHGPRNAAKFLQKAANRFMAGLTVDGIIGDKTLTLVIGIGAILITDILRERDIFYSKIVANDPTQEKFAKGWRNRLSQVTVNARTFT